MARIPTYVASESAQTGAVQQEAPLSVFGSGKGEGMERAGQALMGVGELLDKRRREQEAIWADNVVTNAEIEWNRKMQELQTSAGPGAVGFTGTVARYWDKFQADTLKSAPTGSSSNLLRSSLNNMRQRVTNHAQVFEAQERVAKQIDDVEYNVSQKMALAALDPTQTDELMRTAGIAVSTVNGLTSPSKAADMSRRAKEGIYAASIEGQMARGDSRGALERLTAKDEKGNVEAVKYLGGAKYVSLLNEAQSRAAHATAFDVAEGKKDFEDNLALIADGKTPRTGFSVPGIAQRVTGANKDQFDVVHKSMATQVTGAYWTAFGREQLRGKSEVERAAVLAQMSAKPEDVPFRGRLPAEGLDPATGVQIQLLDYKYASELHKDLVAWNRADVAGMQADPASYFSTTNPEVGRAYQSAASAASSYNTAKSSGTTGRELAVLEAQTHNAFQSAIKSNLLAQERAGIPTALQQVLPLSRAATINQEILSGRIDGIVPYFQQMQAEYGDDYYEKALHGLMNPALKGDALDPVYAEVGMTWRQTGATRLVLEALRARQKDPKAFAETYPTKAEEEAATQALYTEDYRNFLQATSVNGGGLPFQRAKLETAKLLMFQFQREAGSSNVTGAARKAATLKFTDYAHYLEQDGGHMLAVPKLSSQGQPIEGFSWTRELTPGIAAGGNMDMVQYNLRNLQTLYADWPAEKFSDEHFASANPHLSAEQRSKIFNEALRSNSFWVTNGKNAELWIEGGAGEDFPVKLKNGNVVSYSFDALAFGNFGDIRQAEGKSEVRYQTPFR